MSCSPIWASSISLSRLDVEYIILRYLVEKPISRLPQPAVDQMRRRWLRFRLMAGSRILFPLISSVGEGLMI